MDDSRKLALQGLASDIGHDFQDLSLLDWALSHSSWVHEHPDEANGSNERLEFLGDAVLELVITEHLFRRFPEANEGQLSKARSGVVNENRLAATARALSLGEHLLLGKGEEGQGGRDKPSILADALEAIVAAVYLDGGLEAARGVLQGLLAEVAERSLARAPKRDFKTRLQERVQEALHITPRYKLLAASGPDHDKTFLVVCLVEEREVAQGSGKSKKEAEQEAARAGLEVLQQEGMLPA
ncbi:ribonuclease III [Desulfocarbo indianensis]|nr:ribonuclease III [Desulfocarbo indianensis]